MNYIQIFFFICLLAISSCSKVSKQETSVAGQKVKKSFFVPTSIAQFSPLDCPCIEVGIGEKNFFMGLDLGFRGDLVLAPPFIDEVEPKVFLRTSPMYGMKGKEYLTNFYRIPEMNIGVMFFTNPVLQEESPDFSNDSTIVKEGHEPSPSESGRLGWELFYHVNLLLDLAHSEIAFCDSVETLREQGYLVKQFIKAPLFLERGLVEIQAETPQGSLRCMLDTGATWSILNTELEGGKSIEEAMWDPENALEYSSFKIGGRDFGPIVLSRIPIKFPIHVEAILGMDFLRNHLIFIDFSGESIYLAEDE